MPLQPYLFFNGRCEEALDFYRKALGAEVTALVRNKDVPPSPQHPVPPGAENRVLHASLRIGDATLMASDGDTASKPRFEGFALSLPARDRAEAGRLFAALADGGQVRVPLTKTFFSSHFGIVADRFGVSWMIAVGQ
jgi:PhnB protein